MLFFLSDVFSFNFFATCASVGSYMLLIWDSVGSYMLLIWDSVGTSLGHRWDIFV